METKDDLAQRIFDICAHVYGKDSGIYIEAGANDGISYSNTLRLEAKLNWTGILVEPGVPAFALLVMNRPKNINLNLALVGSLKQKYLLGTFSSGSLLSSGHPQLKYRDIAKLDHNLRGVARIRRRFGLNPKVTEIEVKAVTLDEIIDNTEFLTINLLVLDVEGMEVDVLKGLILHKPEIIVIESREINVWELAELMLEKGYLLLGDITDLPGDNVVIEHKDLVWVSSGKAELIILVLEAIQLLSQK
jgi:FkbM family methyltransferase